MINIHKKENILIIVSVLVWGLVACGNNGVENKNTEFTQGTEEIIEIETETEFEIEIVDAEDILLKTWSTYKSEERFKIMGGHFSSAVIGLPAKYDLVQSEDLVQIYCFPESRLSIVDDAATMIDLFNAARFTVGVYHVTDIESIQGIADDMKKQIIENEWHGEKPEKLCIIKVDEQYMVSIYGRETFVNVFKQKLESIYSKMTEVMVEEKLF